MEYDGPWARDALSCNPSREWQSLTCTGHTLVFFFAECPFHAREGGKPSMRCFLLCSTFCKSLMHGSERWDRASAAWPIEHDTVTRHGDVQRRIVKLQEATSAVTWVCMYLVFAVRVMGRLLAHRNGLAPSQGDKTIKVLRGIPRVCFAPATPALTASQPVVRARPTGTVVVGSVREPNGAKVAVGLLKKRMTDGEVQRAAASTFFVFTPTCPELLRFIFANLGPGKPQTR